MGVASSRYGPTIWIPTGSPPGVKPTGAVVAGRPASNANEVQKHRSRIGPLAPRRGEHAHDRRAGLIVRKRGDERGRQQEGVVRAEVGLPDAARDPAPRLHGLHVGIGRGDRAGVAREVRGVLAGRELPEAGELLLAHRRREARDEQRVVGVELLPGIHPGRPALGELGAGAAQRLDRGGERVAHLRRHRGARIVEHVADAVVREPRAARGRQRPAPGPRLVAVGPAQHLEGGAQVAGGARERAGHRQRRGRRRRDPRRRRDMAAHRHHVERGLVAVDPAEVRGDADRAARDRSPARDR